MQRTGHKRPANMRAKFATPSARNAAAFSKESLHEDLMSSREADSSVSSKLSDDSEIRRRSLEIAIHQRIETRLARRIRDLHVRVVDDVVILEGECATFYTKQLAQHAAMGILEDEHLENSIVVSVQ